MDTKKVETETLGVITKIKNWVIANPHIALFLTGFIVGFVVAKVL